MALCSGKCCLKDHVWTPLQVPLGNQSDFIPGYLNEHDSNLRRVNRPLVHDVDTDEGFRNKTSGHW